MSTYLGMCELSEHNPDPEEFNHRIAPGEWVKASCDESNEARKNADLKVWSSLTDPDGTFGTACLFTEWGTHDGLTPVVADYRRVKSDASCEHYVYVVTANESARG